MKQSRAINVHLGSELKEKWKKFCEDRGKSPGVMIREAIERQLDGDDIVDLAFEEKYKNVGAIVKPVSSRTTSTEGGRPMPSVEDRLLGAMERLIEQGEHFSSLTVEQLAREAGIARATFYVHFSDKSELVVKLMDRLTQDVVGSAGVWFRPMELDPENVDLKKTLTGIFTAFKKHQAILTAIIATAGGDKNVARLHRQMIDELCAQSRQAVLATTDGQFPGKVSAELLADVLTQVIELFCAHNIASFDGRRLEALIDTFTHICQQAIFYKSIKNS